MFTPSKQSTVHTNRAAYFDRAPLHNVAYDTVTPVKDFIRPVRADHDRFIHNPSADRVFITGIHSTPQHAPTTPCQMSSTMAEDASLVCGDPVLFPTFNAKRTGKLMNRPPFESPAKIFARMKAKVRSRHQVCENAGTTKTENEVFSGVGEEKGGVFKSPLKRQQHWAIDDMKEKKRLRLAHHDDTDVEALTFSPIHSPRKFNTKDLPRPSPLKEQLGAFLTSSRATPVKAKGPASQDAFSVTEPPRKVSSRPHSQVGSKENQQLKTPLKKDFDHIFKTSNRTTPVENQAASLKSADGCGKNQFVEQAFLKWGITPIFNSSVILERLPSLASPAKILHDMKERERRRGQQEPFQVSSTTHDPRSGVRYPPRKKSTSTPVDSGHEDDASVGVSTLVSSSFNGVAVPAVQLESSVPSSPEAAHSQCEFLLDEAPPPKPLPDLVDDVLLHVSPRVSIPKKREAVFQTKHKVESKGAIAAGIHLRGWILRSNSMGLYVDGYRVDNGVPWHSSVITERVSSNVLKTVSGGTYVLVGKMAQDWKTAFPRWLLKKFFFGFPKHWKDYYQKYLSEPKGVEADSIRQETVSKDKAPAEKRHNRYMKQQSSQPQKTRTQRTPLAISTANTTLNSGAAKVSRSGRVLKAPLEYWRGGRVILDGDMNVTIHESYDISVCNSHVSTPVARAPSKRTKTPAKALLSPTGEELTQRDSSSTEDVEFVPLRKVRSHRRRPQRIQPEGDVSHRSSPRPDLVPRKSSLTNPELRSRPRKTSSPPHPSTQPATAVYAAPAPPQSPTLPRRSLRQANQQSSQEESTDTDTPSTVLPSKQRTVLVLDGPYSQATGRSRQAPARKTPKHPESQSDTDREEGDPERRSHSRKPRPASAATGRGQKAQGGGRHDTGGESAQSDDDFTVSRKPRVKALRSAGSALPQGRRTPRRILEHSEAESSQLLTSPEDCSKVEVRKRVNTPKPRGGKKNSAPPESSQLFTSPEDCSAMEVRKRVNVPNPRGGKTSKDLTSPPPETESSQLFTSPEDCSAMEVRKRVNVPNPRGGKTTTMPPPEVPQPHKKTTKGKNGKAVSRVGLQEEEVEDAAQWTVAELARLHQAVTSLPKNMSSFWLNVAMEVGTRSAEECQEQHTAQTGPKVTMSAQVTTKAKKKKNKKEAPQKEQPVMEAPKITAKVGTLKRKQQVRNFLDHMPKDNHDDIFSSSPMQNKRVKLPTVSPTRKDQVFTQSGEYDPQTPTTAGFPAVKTPKCLHITPGMMGPIDGNDNDHYLFQLQKRSKKGQIKVPQQAPSAKNDIPTPSVKRAMRRCSGDEENDSFVVWEMFPDKESASDDSGEEEDYYFQDDH